MPGASVPAQCVREPARAGAVSGCGMRSWRLSGTLVAALAVAWTVLQAGLMVLSDPPRGPCGRPAPFEAEHTAALCVGMFALALAWLGRRRFRRTLELARALGRAVPILAAATMLGLCLEALFTPFYNCASVARGAPLPWWSAWHHLALPAFAAALARLGASRLPARCDAGSQYRHRPRRRRSDRRRLWSYCRRSRCRSCGARTNDRCRQRGPAVASWSARRV